MLKTIIIRVVLGLLTLWAVSVLIFAATEVLPGDVASAILGQGATPETLAVFRHELGLDRPSYIRYFEWFFNALHGDLGIAMTNKRVIVEVLAPRLANTLFLAGYAALIAIPTSVVLGIVAAINEGKFIDRFVNIISLMTISVPEFFIAYVLILYLAVQFEVFPSLSTVFPEMGLLDKIYITALPAFTLTMLVMAHMLRMTRTSVLSIMSQPYIEMAFLKGLPKWRVVVQHAFPNALAPIINVIALNLAYLIVGVVVVEAVFVYPGLGQLMVDAVSKHDVPVVQACGLIFASAFILLNMTADILAIMSNPRLRHPR